MGGGAEGLLCGTGWERCLSMGGMDLFGFQSAGMEEGKLCTVVQKAGWLLADSLLLTRCMHALACTPAHQPHCLPPAAPLTPCLLWPPAVPHNSPLVT